MLNTVQGTHTHTRMLVQTHLRTYAHTHTHRERMKGVTRAPGQQVEPPGRPKIVGAPIAAGRDLDHAGPFRLEGAAMYYQEELVCECKKTMGMLGKH